MMVCRATQSPLALQVLREAPSTTSTLVPSTTMCGVLNRLSQHQYRKCEILLFLVFFFFFTLNRYNLWIRVKMADPTLFQSTPSLRFLLSGLSIICDSSSTGLTFSVFLVIFSAIFFFFCCAQIQLVCFISPGSNCIIFIAVNPAIIS